MKKVMMINVSGNDSFHMELISKIVIVCRFYINESMAQLNGYIPLDDLK